MRTGPASYGLNSSISSSPLKCSRGRLGIAYIEISVYAYNTGPFEDITDIGGKVWPPFFIGNQIYAPYFYDEQYPYLDYPCFRDQSITMDDDGVITAANIGGTLVTPWYPDCLRGFRSTGTTYAARQQAKLLGPSKGVLCQYTNTPGGIDTSTVPTDYEVIDNGRGSVLFIDVTNIPSDGEQTWARFWAGLTLDDFSWY